MPLPVQYAVKQKLQNGLATLLAEWLTVTKSAQGLQAQSSRILHGFGDTDKS